MTGWEALAVWGIWIVLFGGAALIVSRLEKKKEERELARNMEEHRIRRNRRAIIEDMERGEW